MACALPTSFRSGRATKYRVKRMMKRLISPDFHQHADQDANFHRGEFRIDTAQAEPHVQQAQHLQRSRVGVAVGLAAGGLVEDRSHHVETPLTIRPSQDLRPPRQIHLLQGQRTDVAGRTRIEAAVFLMADLFGPSGESQQAVPVEHPDMVDALVLGNRLHRLVGVIAAVGQHGVPSGAGDAARELVGAFAHHPQHLPLLARYGIKPGEGRDGYHDDGRRDHQTLRQVAEHCGPPDPLLL